MLTDMRIASGHTFHGSLLLVHVDMFRFGCQGFYPISFPFQVKRQIQLKTLKTIKVRRRILCAGHRTNANFDAGRTETLAHS